MWGRASRRALPHEGPAGHAGWASSEVACGLSPGAPGAVTGLALARLAAPQTVDGHETVQTVAGGVFHGDGALEEGWVGLSEPVELVGLGGRAEVAGALGRDGQADRGDFDLAAIPVPSPFTERIAVAEVLVLDPVGGSAAVLRARVLANELDVLDALSEREPCRSPAVVPVRSSAAAEEEVVHCRGLPFQAAALHAEGERGQSLVA